MKKLWRKVSSGLIRRPVRHLESGTTLIEMMVVLAIITLIGGVVAVAVFNQFKKAQIDTTRTQIKQIADALELYKLGNRKYPSTGEGLQALTSPQNGGPVMPSIPTDPWGNQFVYIYPSQTNAQGFEILSYGPDGTSGGGDDVSNGASGEAKN